MTPSVWINGRLIPEKKAGIPVTDSAYLLGHGVFETLRSLRGRVLFLPEHFSRMKRNAARLWIPMPLSRGRFEREIYRALRKNRLREATIRVTLSLASPGKPRLVIAARRYVPYPKICYRKGGRLIQIRSARNDPPAISNLKTTNYLSKALAREEVRRRRAVEGVLLNAGGRVTEGGSSNLFIIKKGRLLTPPLSEGVMPGTRRALVLKLARNLGIPLKEKVLLPADLKEADEIFITSTLKDILPIGTFEGKRIGKKSPGPVTLRLMVALGKLVV